MAQLRVGGVGLGGVVEALGAPSHTELVQNPLPRLPTTALATDPTMRALLLVEARELLQTPNLPTEHPTPRGPLVAAMPDQAASPKVHGLLGSEVLVGHLLEERLLHDVLMLEVESCGLGDELGQAGELPLPNPLEPLVVGQALHVGGEGLPLPP